MAESSHSGLGLFGKMVFISLIPSCIIAAILIYLNDRDLKRAITQKYIEEALSAASSIQEKIPFSTFIQDPAEAERELKEIIHLNPDFLEISIYASTEEGTRAIISTNPKNRGRTADRRDLALLTTGQASSHELVRESESLLEVVAPFRENGKISATIGIYLSTATRDISAARMR